MPITIAVVEDDEKTRRGFADFIDGESRVCCAGFYATGESAAREIPLTKPDVVLVEIKLPDMSGIECVRRLKKSMPRLKLLMLTDYEESDFIFNSFRAGAGGYLLKKTLEAELIPAIELIHAGGAPMAMDIARKMVEHYQQTKPRKGGLGKLTPREHEVLTLLAKGFLYKEVSDLLGISQHTFRAHQRAIYEKLDVHSRTEATIKFLGQG